MRQYIGEWLFLRTLLFKKKKNGNFFYDIFKIGLIGAPYFCAA